jgi:hypothetical protein
MNETAAIVLITLFTTTSLAADVAAVLAQR